MCVEREAGHIDLTRPEFLGPSAEPIKQSLIGCRLTRHIPRSGSERHPPIVDARDLPAFSICASSPTTV